jgi:hypothetical protein
LQLPSISGGHWCENWSVTLREECNKFRVLENRVLKRIFGPGVGDWRRLHNEELYNFYTSSDIITVIKSRSMRWAGT